MKLSEISKEQLDTDEDLRIGYNLAQKWGFDYDFETQEVIDNGKRK